jgi:outer membrane protein assembly factor BamB
LIHKQLAIGVVLLFIVSSVTPMVFGFDAETKDIDCELEAELANLRYMCTTPDGFNEAEYEYYKEELLNSDYFEYDGDEVSAPVEARVNEEIDLALPLDGPMNSSWSMLCHDTHHTGRISIGTSDISYVELWRFPFDGGIENSPVVGNDGIIYVPGRIEGYKHHLFAIYPNGTLKWKYRVNSHIFWTCPAIAEDGTIYFVCWDGNLYAINPNGTKKWTFHVGDYNIGSAPAIAEDGTIYFGTMIGLWSNVANVIAVNPNGTEKWRYPVNHYVDSDPVIGDDGTVYIGSDDRNLYAIYPNGTLKWTFRTGDDIRGPASIANDGTIYFCSWDYYLYAVYPNGTLRWKTKPYWYGSQTNPSIGEDGTIYVSWGGRIFAFNPENGEVIWEFVVGGRIGKSSIAICADEILYVGVEIGDRDGGEILAVNSDGTKRWRQRISNGYADDSSPAIAEDGTIYIVSSGDKCGLHAFGPLDPNAPEAPIISGELKGRPETSYEYTFSAVDPNDDDVFYQIYWGNGEDLYWFGPWTSGEEVVVDFTYYWEGTFRILARAKDINDLYGPWSELEVTMPVNQHSYSFPLLQRLLERFPNMFPILRHLFDLK